MKSDARLLQILTSTTVWFLSCVLMTAQTNEPLVLAEVGGFEDDETYPVGDLQPVTDGGATWTPASSAPAQIVSLGATNAHGKVLRRTQAGDTSLDRLHFPPVSSGPLTVEFDARASTAASRTLDVFLEPSSGNEVSLLGLSLIHI